MIDIQRKQILLDKYLQNSCTLQELEELYDTLATEEDTTPYKKVLASLWMDIKEERRMETGKADKMLRHILETGGETRPRVRTFFYWRAAAVLLPIIVALALFWQSAHRNKRTIPGAVAAVTRPPIAGAALPGSHKAILILDNGQQLDLTDSIKREQLRDNGIRVDNDDSRLVYDEADAARPKEVRYNMLITPRGSEYAVVLGDGTKVWLNAGSSLRYPVGFPGSERRVELTGEAYFEVVHDSSQPFVVLTGGVKMTDLGTAFNINAYADEPEIRTTLVQGKISVTGAHEGKVIVLDPGYEARIDKKSRMDVVKASLKEALAWRNGLFSFSTESLGSILRKLSRWYNIDVKMDDAGLEKLHFTGTVQKYEKIETVLQMLELTNEVSFILEGNTLEVKRK